MNTVPERLLHSLIGEIERVADNMASIVSRQVSQALEADEFAQLEAERDDLFELVKHYRNEAATWEERSEKRENVVSDLPVSSWENTVTPQDAAFNFLVDTTLQT